MSMPLASQLRSTVLKNRVTTSLSHLNLPKGRVSYNNRLPFLTLAPALQNLQCVRSRTFSASAAAQTSEKEDPLASLVSAQDVKRLRDITGSSFGNCRRALVESHNDLDKALDWLKSRNVAAAKTRWDKKADEMRNIDGSVVLPQSLIGMKIDNNDEKTKYSIGVILRLGAETDFVIKNEVFQNLLLRCCEKCIESEKEIISIYQSNTITDTEEMQTAIHDVKARFKAEVAQECAQIGAKLGESLALQEYEILTSDSTENTISGYIHPYSTDGSDLPNVGRIAALVKAKQIEINTTDTDGSTISKPADIGRKLARHIASFTPKYWKVSDIDTDVLESEKQIYKAQLLNKGGGDTAASKNIPENKMEAILNGKLAKFYGEEVLEKQSFLYDDVLTVGKWLEGFGQEGIVDGWKLMK